MTNTDSIAAAEVTALARVSIINQYHATIYYAVRTYVPGKKAGSWKLAPQERMRRVWGTSFADACEIADKENAGKQHLLPKNWKNA